MSFASPGGSVTPHCHLVFGQSMLRWESEAVLSIASSTPTDPL